MSIPQQQGKTIFKAKMSPPKKMDTDISREPPRYEACESLRFFISDWPLGVKTSCVFAKISFRAQIGTFICA